MRLVFIVLIFAIVLLIAYFSATNLINIKEQIDDATPGFIEKDIPYQESNLINKTFSNSIFKTYAKPEFMLSEDSAVRLEFELRPDLDELYHEISPKEQNIIVIFPSFTLSAYSKSGFYDYYQNKCDEKCLEVPIRNDFEADFQSSGNGYRILKLLGYKIISDIEIDKNPDLIKNYNKVILLHNEYVTKNIFNAITSHPNVVYLYPNSLYAEVESNYQTNTIKLIKGHSYPTSDIDNGFDWEYDNTRPYEFDIECIDWYFYSINNGIMLNCYPENMIYVNAFLLKAILDSDNTLWHNVNQRESGNFSDSEWKIMYDLFNLLPN